MLYLEWDNHMLCCIFDTSINEKEYNKRKTKVPKFVSQIQYVDGATVRASATTYIWADPSSPPSDFLFVVMINSDDSQSLN